MDNKLKYLLSLSAKFHSFEVAKILYNNMNLNLKDWEKKRIKEGLFLVNRSREMGSYLTYNKVISMPSYNKVLEETAVSIKHIANYPNKII